VPPPDPIPIEDIHSPRLLPDLPILVTPGIGENKDSFDQGDGEKVKGKKERG
jgi:hypothetical protein